MRKRLSSNIIQERDSENSSPPEENLKLILSKCNIGSGQLEYLMRMDLSKLKELWLDCNRIDDRELRILSKGKLPSLLELHLNKNCIGSYGARCIISIEMPQLSLLYINQNYLGNEGLSTLTKSQWPNLLSLNLVLNDITEEGLRQLQYGNWRHLKYLYLGKNKMEVAAAMGLAACQLPNIKKISFSKSVVFVGNAPHGPYLLPTHQQLEQVIVSSLPTNWGVEFSVE